MTFLNYSVCENRDRAPASQDWLELWADISRLFMWWKQVCDIIADVAYRLTSFGYLPFVSERYSPDDELGHQPKQNEINQLVQVETERHGTHPTPNARSNGSLWEERKVSARAWSQLTGTDCVYTCTYPYVYSGVDHLHSDQNYLLIRSGTCQSGLDDSRWIRVLLRSTWLTKRNPCRHQATLTLILKNLSGFRCS